MKIGNQKVILFPLLISIFSQVSSINSVNWEEGGWLSTKYKLRMGYIVKENYFILPVKGNPLHLLVELLQHLLTLQQSLHSDLNRNSTSKDTALNPGVVRREQTLHAAWRAHPLVFKPFIDNFINGKSMF